MSLQTTFTNVKHGWAFDTNPPTEFQRQYDAMCEQFPLMIYPCEMGYRQGIADSYAGAKNEADFKSKGLKKADAIHTGTVRVAGSGVARQPTKSPLERAMWEIASGEMAESLAKYEKRNGAVSKADRNGLIHQYMVRHHEAILSKAEAQIAGMANLAKVAALDLDAVLAAVAESGEVGESGEVASESEPEPASEGQGEASPEAQAEVQAEASGRKARQRR